MAKAAQKRSTKDGKTRIRKLLHDIQTPCSLGAWFGKFDYSGFDESKHIADNFVLLVRHLGFQQNGEIVQYLYIRFAEFVRTGEVLFSRKSGCAAYSQHYLQRFHGFKLNFSQTLKENVTRLCHDGTWKDAQDESVAAHLRALHNDILSGLCHDLSKRRDIKLVQFSESTKVQTAADKGSTTSLRRDSDRIEPPNEGLTRTFSKGASNLAATSATTKTISINSVKSSPAVRYIPEWFHQFPGYTYDESKDVVENFILVSEHAGLTDEHSQEAYTKLISVVVDGSVPFPTRSGCDIYVVHYLSRFEGFIVNRADSLVVTMKRLVSDSRWNSTWGPHNSKPLLKIRAFIESVMRGELRIRYVERLDHAQLDSSTSNQVGPALMAGSFTSHSTSDVHCNNYGIHRSKTVVLDAPLVDSLVLATAGTWFAQRECKGFTFDASRSAGDNLKSCAQARSISKTERRVFLEGLLRSGISGIKPDILDVVFTRDYASRFFERHPKFVRKSTLSPREEFGELCELKKWNKSQRAVEGERLRNLMSADMIKDILGWLKDTRSLSSLTNGWLGNLSLKSAKHKTMQQTKPASRPRPSKSTSETIDDAVNTRFFDRYPLFTREPTETLMTEFERLAISEQWKQGSKTYQKQKADFVKDQFQEEWDEIMYTPDDSEEDDDPENIGVDISKALKLSQWQNLCTELGIDPVPRTATQCRKALKQVYVNIWDLLDARRSNNVNGDGSVTVRRFASEKALAKYTRDTQRYFPKGAAKRQGALKALLVHVFGRVGGGNRVV